MLEFPADTSNIYVILFSFYFQLKTKRPSLKLDSPPDEELKENLLEIFLRITEAEKRHAQK